MKLIFQFKKNINGFYVNLRIYLQNRILTLVFIYFFKINLKSIKYVLSILLSFISRLGNFADFVDNFLIKLHTKS
jgi:hypothetical protein